MNFIHTLTLYIHHSTFNMKSKNLPTEVLDQIFSRLKLDTIFNEAVDKKTIGQCVLICKQWKIPAQRVYFSTIRLETQKQTDRLIQALKNSKSSPGVFIHKVIYELYKRHEENSHISYYGSYEDEDEEVRHSDNIKSFVDLFPELQYMIWEHRPTRDFYGIFTQALILSKLTKLKRINHPRARGHLDLYMNCAMAARHSITSMEIHGTDDINNSDPYSRLSNRLDLFPLLEVLDIRDSLDKFIENMEYYTTCQSTVKSIIYNTRPIVETVMPAVDLSLIKPQPQINFLSMFSLAFRNDDSLRYFMKTFPQLNTFRVNRAFTIMKRMEFFVEVLVSTHRNFSPNVLGQFLAFIKKIPNHTVYHLYSSASVVDILKSFWKYLSTTAATSTTTKKSLTLSYADETNYDEDYFGGTENTVNIRMECEQDQYQQPYHPEFRYNGAGGQLLHLQVLEEIGDQLKELCIFNIGGYKMNNVIESDMTDESK